MTEDDAQKPLLWLIDSQRPILNPCLALIESWAEVICFDTLPALESWRRPPTTILFAAEIEGGAKGEIFSQLVLDSGEIPVVVVARLRSLAQALAYFRAGATDCLSLPLEARDIQDSVSRALERATQIALRGVMLEVEPVAADAEEIDLNLEYVANDARVGDYTIEDDILAQLSLEAEQDSSEEEEPELVDGLPIPSMWEELPCGVLVFDCNNILLFSNTLGMELLGYTSMVELQEALENRRDLFKAYATNRTPLADNQWPQIIAAKTRTARSALISIERPDNRRSWLCIDCRPHLYDGQLSRLCMTMVNLTGELPPFVEPSPQAAKLKPVKSKQRAKKKK